MIANPLRTVWNTIRQSAADLIHDAVKFRERLRTLSHFLRESVSVRVHRLNSCLEPVHLRIPLSDSSSPFREVADCMTIPLRPNRIVRGCPLSRDRERVRVREIVPSHFPPSKIVVTFCPSAAIYR